MNYLVIFDDPSRGGDGTFLTDSDEDDLWSHDRERTRLMVQSEAELALYEVDGGELLRHRLLILPAERFGLPLPASATSSGQGSKP